MEATSAGPIATLAGDAGESDPQLLAIFKDLEADKKAGRF